MPELARWVAGHNPAGHHTDPDSPSAGAHRALGRQSPVQGSPEARIEEAAGVDSHRLPVDFDPGVVGAPAVGSRRQLEIPLPPIHRVRSTAHFGILNFVTNR